MNKNKLYLCISVISLEAILCCKNDKKECPNKFPDIFYMDDYYECSKNKGNSYCTGNMNLIPKDEKSELWKQIRDWSKPQNHYNHSIVHRTFCIPSEHKNYLEKTAFIENKTNEELKMYGFSSKLFSMDCMEEKSFKVDIAILTGLFIYGCLILLATVYDQLYDIRTKESIFGKWLTCFSLVSNWKKITSDKNPDYQKLKCIQGIQTYQSVIVIVFHVIVAAGQLNIKNTSFFEEIYSNPAIRAFIVFSTFVMQTWFLISAWLLTNQVLEIYKGNGRFSIRDALVIFLHRVTRFWAPFAISFIGNRIYVNLFYGPGNFAVANLTTRNCEKNWWATFFLVTNWLNINEVCQLGLWPISIDSQFYVAGIVFLYVALNYNMDIKTCLIYMLICTYAVNVAIFYQNDFPLFSWINLNYHVEFKMARNRKRKTNIGTFSEEQMKAAVRLVVEENIPIRRAAELHGVAYVTLFRTLKPIDFYHNKIWENSYFGFWVNAGSSLIGILFGYIYFLHKNSTKIKVRERLCIPVFAIVSFTAVLLGDLDTGRFVSVFVGPLLKPLFGVGIASGIYGMSRNIIQGWSKSICENKYVVLLGNFTFSTYICHFLIVFTSEVNSTKLVEITAVKLALSFIRDVLASFALGFLFALTIDQPGINIKNMILPKVKKKEE